MSELKSMLDRVQARYHQTDFLSSDPLEFLHHYKNPWDQEVVALVSALLAYGNVKQIRRSIQEALRLIAEVSPAGPAAFVRSLGTPIGLREARGAFKGYVHRFNVGADLVLLFCLIERSWREHSSVGAHFLRAHEPRAEDISAALDALISDWKRWALELGALPGSSFFYLLTAPEDGSCCKRWCMLLRWMGRKDALDPGLWTEGSALSKGFAKGRHLRADQLVLPLDTHTGRISQYLGLTERKTLGWRAALEVTSALRLADPGDPTRYDFALARLGILDLCQRKYRREICEGCDLRSACRFARAGRAPSPKKTRAKARA